MLRKLTISTLSEEETIRLGGLIGGALQPGDVALLTGDLGSGKTRLAKGIVSVAANTPVDEVVSPTFTLINRFDGPFPILHVDLYRITGDQVDDIGLEDSLEQESALVIEWAEIVSEVFEDPLKISIDYTAEDNVRTFEFGFEEDGAWAERIERVLDRFRKGSTRAG
jgi:tRNA threonylcarbamoyladenosine biosynthesis protein TsaE